MNIFTPKAASSGVAGSVSVILIWVLSSICHITIPPEIASAFTVVISFGVAAFAPHSQPTPEQVTKILQDNPSDKPTT